MNHRGLNARSLVREAEKDNPRAETSAEGDLVPFSARERSTTEASAPPSFIEGSWLHEATG